MHVAHPRAVLSGLAVALCALALGACGSSTSSSSSAAAGGASSSSSSVSTSSSSTSSSSSATSTAAAGPAKVKGLEHALLASRTTPQVSAVTCRLETAGERSRSPFGLTGPAVFACSITAGGPPTAYDVQLLPTGCFVAERRTPGKAIYGCGAGKA